MTPATIKLIVVVGYFVVVLAIGTVAYRRRRATADDYFLGSRTARTVVLFMALFGTNITPFALMGYPGLAYHDGVGVFGYLAAFTVLGVPLVFYLIGYPAWIASRRLGAVTPAELYSRRFGSPALGVVMFVVFFAYTVPYMVTAVTGVGLAVDVLSDRAIEFEYAALGILVITIGYTSLGGMRATMWTNVFQGSVFLLLLVVAVVIVVGDLGGLRAVVDQVGARNPELLIKQGLPKFEPAEWASWSLAMALCVIAFPHVFVRVFAARDVRALKNACRLYPPAMIVLWTCGLVLGIAGTIEFGDLAGKESERVFPLLVGEHFGPVLQGVALAAILAAVMSTLDAQMLTLSSMLTRDVLGALVPGIPGERQVLFGRTFLVLLMVVTFGIVVTRPASIFDIAKLSFSGYVTLVPAMFLSLRWRRFNAAGAIASIVLGNLVLIGTFTAIIPALGLMPVAWGLLTAIGAGVAVSLMTEPPDAELTERVFGPIDAAMRGPAE